MCSTILSAPPQPRSHLLKGVPCSFTVARRVERILRRFAYYVPCDPTQNSLHATGGVDEAVRRKTFLHKFHFRRVSAVAAAETSQDGSSSRRVKHVTALACKSRLNHAVNSTLAATSAVRIRTTTNFGRYVVVEKKWRGMA